MSIILVSSRLSIAKTLILERKDVWGGCFMLVLALAALINDVTLRYLAQNRHLHLFSLSSAAVRDDSTASQDDLREDLDAMSTRLGELLPSILVLSVKDGVFASHFGRRLDSFNGRSSFHEGRHFLDAMDTTIVGAVPRVVVASEHHPQYGKMVKIDPGNGLMTRYAHGSRLLARWVTS